MSRAMPADREGGPALCHQGSMPRSLRRGPLAHYASGACRGLEVCYESFSSLGWRLNPCGPGRCRPLARPGRAAEPAAAKSPHTITAKGAATVTGKPDSARVYFGVQTSGATVGGAREENAHVVGKIQEALVALKLADVKARTTDSNVSVKFDRDDRHIVGYEVGQSFTVLLKDEDPEKLAATAQRVLDTGLKNGVNYGGFIEFFKADNAELRRRAMSQAVEDAFANAQAYAAGAKVKIAEVVEIATDDSYDEGFQFGGGGQGGGLGGKGNVLAGEWKVSARVRIVCRY